MVKIAPDDSDFRKAVASYWAQTLSKPRGVFNSIRSGDQKLLTIFGGPVYHIELRRGATPEQAMRVVENLAFKTCTVNADKHIYPLGFKNSFIKNLSEEKFEKLSNELQNRYGRETEEDTVKGILYQVAREERVRQTGFMLFAIWLATSLSIAFTSQSFTLFSWKTYTWFGLTWLIFLWIIGFIIPFVNHLAPNYIVTGEPEGVARIFAYVWWWSKVVLVILLVSVLFKWWFGIE